MLLLAHAQHGLLIETVFLDKYNLLLIFCAGWLFSCRRGAGGRRYWSTLSTPLDTPLGLHGGNCSIGSLTSLAVFYCRSSKRVSVLKEQWYCVCTLPKSRSATASLALTHGHLRMEVSIPSRGVSRGVVRVRAPTPR